MSQSPQQLLEKSSELSNVFLLNIATSHANNPISLNWIFQMQHTNPRYLQRLVAVSPYVQRAPTLPKRGVNSFMAFRAFYSQIFTAFQQKSSSTLIKLLWDTDPFRAKWSIVARAYTDIRDKVGKANAPIATFLELVCPKIGIISCDQYFKMMNWAIEPDNGSIILKQSSIPNYSNFPYEIMNTPMTERDVTYYCAQRGYISVFTASQVATFPQAGATNTTPASNNAAMQQGLLASAPPQNLASSNAALQQGLLASAPPQNLAPKEDFIAKAIIDPMGMASEVLGLDFGGLLGWNEQHEWGNNDFDLYNPEEGVFNFEAYLDSYQNSPWDAFSMDDAQAMEKFLEAGGLQEGFISPEVLADAVSEEA